MVNELADEIATRLRRLQVMLPVKSGSAAAEGAGLSRVRALAGYRL